MGLTTVYAYKNTVSKSTERPIHNRKLSHRKVSSFNVFVENVLNISVMIGGEEV